MVNKILTRSSGNVFQHQSHSSSLKRPTGGVMQDKRAKSSARPASTQPLRYPKKQRAPAMNRELSRSQNQNNDREKRQPVTIWIRPIARALLQKKAQSEDLSLSAAGAAIFERAIQQDLDMQYGALLEPIIERCIDRKMEGMTTKLAWLLVRVAFDVGQVRGMTTNILGRQPGMNQDILTTILKESSNTAKSNITRKTPQLKELMNLIEKWLHENEKGRG